MEFRLQAVHTPSLPKQGWPPPHLENEIAREGVHPARRTCAPRYIIPLRGIASQVCPASIHLRIPLPTFPSSFPLSLEENGGGPFCLPSRVHRCTLARFKPLSGDEFCLWPVPLTGTRGYELWNGESGWKLESGPPPLREECSFISPLAKKLPVSKVFPIFLPFLPERTSSPFPFENLDTILTRFQVFQTFPLDTPISKIIILNSISLEIISKILKQT